MRPVPFRNLRSKTALTGLRVATPPRVPCEATRLFDVLMFKKDALHFFLHEQMDKLGLPIADRETLRAALANPNAYRMRMGQPSFSSGTGAVSSIEGSSIEGSSIEAQSVEGSPFGGTDLTWLGGLSIAGKALFHFIEAGCRLQACGHAASPTNRQTTLKTLAQQGFSNSCNLPTHPSRY